MDDGSLDLNSGRRSPIWVLSSTRQNKFCYLCSPYDNEEIVIWLFSQFTGGINHISNQEPKIDLVYFKYIKNTDYFVYNYHTIYSTQYSPSITYDLVTDIDGKKYLRITAIPWCSINIISNKTIQFVRSIEEPE